jgi:2-oxoglutarate ferredoxin oxidoreductase subunit alpha
MESAKQGTINILIGGEAGQGLATIGQILTKALVRSGYCVVVTQSYMSRIRGGHNTFSIRVSSDEILAPEEEIDLLVALNAETYALHNDEMSGRGKIIVDDTLDISDDRTIEVPFKKLASSKYSNVAALGIAASLIGIEKNKIVEILDEQFSRKHPEEAEENKEALTRSYEWISRDKRSLPTLKNPSQVPSRMMLNGNEAIALGAISAGVRFCSFYPMTPSTSINIAMINHAKKMGLIVEQAEDEIAAINMAIGASYAGVPSMVATSGGGFALMTEGVSLAAMVEIPVVIVVAQRPGPATGMPTRTEQADLEMVLYAGHGEFPRAIFAPGTPEQCFHLTRKAVELAHRYQGPTFILTDQYMADSYRAVKPFDIEKLSAIDPAEKNAAINGPYKRFKITESGVSPRALPGLSKHLVVVDSDEHTEDGHITEDHSVRKSLVEKRLRKMNRIREESIPPHYDGNEDPDLLLVSWGSSMGAVREAVHRMKGEGINAATLHFSQVWPVVPELFMDRLEKAKRVVCVEGNATGQFANLLRRETGFCAEERVRRYDGLPLTPDYVIRELKKSV